MIASKLQESVEVRIARSLHTKEEEFVFERRKTIFQSLQKLKIHCSKDAVPNIALLGSGGGQRAMVGLLGSLVQLDKAGLLDCILYLSGVSGSTWCMASLYQEPDWSTKLDTVTDNIFRRLIGPGVSFKDKLAKLKKYYYEKDHFSLTDVWAVMVVTEYVKEIDKCKLSDQWDQHKEDPFSIYTVIDKQSKQCKDEEDKDDPWFEISPLEAGYSLTGAFVKTCSFGSQFDRGSKTKPQDEMDMLYLQALCGSALADEDEIKKFLWQKINDFFKKLSPKWPSNKETRKGKLFLHLFMDKFYLLILLFCSCFPLPNERSNSYLKAPSVEKGYQVLRDLANMNLDVLNGKDPSDLDQSIRNTLNELSGGKHQLIFPIEKLNLEDKEAAECYMNEHTEDVCKNLNNWFSLWPFDVLTSIHKCMAQWIWGRKYGFLQNINDETLPSTLLESDIRDYEDTGLLLNSPYFSVLRKERNIDLIISLDFSEGDPFMTVREAAKMCKKRNIPFPEVNIPSEDLKNPEDFYVFKGTDTPTVIHIPLFNVVNCGGKFRLSS
ncbi:cytosolic phospholipase A2 zeta-like [Carassius auratus]|uniref:Cytosolic phospholipase A2 zeta-like n=1 Tax=Carassius auratus TaxID=7957 RepID=A0A6P6NS52_CARAU|nr:cytosolic phospholipase A2 zeta-like [Carassius auratus]